MISINKYSEDDFPDILEYCKVQSDTAAPAAENMWTESWQSARNTLPFLLMHTDRFNGIKGQFFILRDNDSIIGCSGVYISDFSTDIALLGVRSWLTKDYRKRQIVREYFLPIQKQWAINSNASVLCLSFNEYNKNLRKMFTIGQQLYTRTERHLFYRNFNMPEYPVIIQGVPQWIIYEKLNNWDYNWRSLAL